MKRLLFTDGDGKHTTFAYTDALREMVATEESMVDFETSMETANEVSRQWTEMKGVLRERIEQGTHEENKFVLRYMECLIERDLAESSLDHDERQLDPMLSLEEIKQFVTEQVLVNKLVASGVEKSGVSFVDGFACSFVSSKRPIKKKTKVEQQQRSVRGKPASSYLIDLVKIVLLNHPDAISSSEEIVADVVRVVRKIGGDDSSVRLFLEHALVLVFGGLVRDAGKHLISQFQIDESNFGSRDRSCEVATTCMTLAARTVAMMLPSSLTAHSTCARRDAFSLLSVATSFLFCINKHNDNKNQANSVVLECLEKFRGSSDSLPCLVDALMVADSTERNTAKASTNNTKGLSVSVHPNYLLGELDALDYPWCSSLSTLSSVFALRPRAMVLFFMVVESLAHHIVASENNSEEEYLQFCIQHLSCLNETHPELFGELLRETIVKSCKNGNGDVVGKTRIHDRLGATVAYFRADDAVDLLNLVGSIGARTSMDTKTSLDNDEEYDRFIATIREDIVKFQGVMEGNGDNERDSNLSILALLSPSRYSGSLQGRLLKVQILNRLLYPTIAGPHGSDDEMHQLLTPLLAKRNLVYYTSCAANGGISVNFSSTSGARDNRRIRILNANQNRGLQLLFTPKERAYGFAVSQEETSAVYSQLWRTSRLQLDLVLEAIVSSEILARRDHGELFFDGAFVPNIAALTHYLLHLGQVLLQEDGTYRNIPDVRLVWREKRYLLVSAVLVDSLRYYLRLLNKPADSGVHSVALRYIFVIIDMMSSISCNECGYETLAGQISDALDFKLYTLCLGTLMYSRSGNDQPDAHSLACALYRCLCAVNTSALIVVDSKRSLLRCSDLFSMCTVALDLGYEVGTAECALVVKALRCMSDIIEEFSTGGGEAVSELKYHLSNTNYMKVSEDIFSDNTLPQTNVVAKSQASWSLREALFGHQVQATDGNTSKHESMIVLVPRNPMDALLKALPSLTSEESDINISSASSRFGGATLWEKRVAHSLSRYILHSKSLSILVTENAHDEGASADRLTTTSIVCTVLGGVRELSKVKCSYLEASERMRLVQTLLQEVLFLLLSSMDASSLDTERGEALVCLPRCYENEFNASPMELSTVLLVFTNLYQNLSVRIPPKVITDSINDEIVTSASKSLLGVLLACQRLPGGFSAVPEKCYYPILEVWCTLYGQHRSHESGKEKPKSCAGQLHQASTETLIDCLALLSAWHSAFLKSSWRADLSFVCLSRSEEVIVSPDVVDEAEQRRALFSSSVATTTGNADGVSGMEEAVVVVEPPSSPVPVTVDRSTPPSSGGGLRLGVLIRSSSRSAKKRLHAESLTVSASSRDNLRSAMEVAAVSVPEPHAHTQTHRQRQRAMMVPPVEPQEDDLLPEIPTSSEGKEEKTHNAANLQSNKKLVGSGVGLETTAIEKTEEKPTTSRADNGNQQENKKQRTHESKTEDKEAAAVSKKDASNSGADEEPAAEGWVAAAITQKFGGGFGRINIL
jgi:hypothetical protein